MYSIFLLTFISYYIFWWKFHIVLPISSHSSPSHSTRTIKHGGLSEDRQGKRRYERRAKVKNPSDSLDLSSELKIPQGERISATGRRGPTPISSTTFQSNLS